MEPSQPTAFRHVTVLAHEAAEMLAPAPGRLLVDCTLGGGGHSELLCEGGATVLGLDKDPAALAAASRRLERFGERFVAVHADFRELQRVLDERGISQVHGVLVDLGVSSPQLDDATRGFSFSQPGPLDMRMDPTKGVPLEEWLAQQSERDLAHLIRRLGEEPLAGRVARAILRAFQAGELGDTRALAEVVAAAIPRAKWPRNIHPATRTFQALRIALNDELGALDAWLSALPKVLAPGGRAAAISFHSLEDRAVKRAFAALATGCICPPDLPICGCGRSAKWRLLSRKAVVASEEELAQNPRSRSARLRGIERSLDEGALAESSGFQSGSESGSGFSKDDSRASVFSACPRALSGVGNSNVKEIPSSIQSLNWSQSSNLKLNSSSNQNSNSNLSSNSNLNLNSNLNSNSNLNPNPNLNSNSTLNSTLNSNSDSNPNSNSDSNLNSNLNSNPNSNSISNRNSISKQSFRAKQSPISNQVPNPNLSLNPNQDPHSSLNPRTTQSPVSTQIPNSNPPPMFNPPPHFGAPA